MPHGQTHFQKSWLSKKDRNEHPINRWLTDPDDKDFTAKCTLCVTRIKYGNSGLQQILTHADGKKHKEIAAVRFSTRQFHFEGHGQQLKLPPRTHSDQVTAAEAAWAMNVAKNNYSYNSCDDVADVFKFMFPGPVSSDFTMSRTKLSYLISDGLGPYFHDQLCKSIRKDQNPFAIQFDETGTIQNVKQCDVLVRTWSEAKGEVVTRFLKSLFFGHAKGKDVAESLLSTIEDAGISLKHFLTIGSDGPNVNKTIWKCLNESVKEKSLPGLLEFKPCTIHIVHNAFKQGLQMYGQQAEQLALDVFYWFRAHPCRKEDFFDTQLGLELDEELFLRHVQSRWLTLLPSLQRIIKNWEPLKKYFLTDAPQKAREEKTERVLQNNETYKRICKAVRGRDVFLQIHFLISVKQVFDHILTIFQRQEPLVHIVHEECLRLVKTLLRRFLKPEACEKSLRELVKLDLKKTDIQCGDHQLEVGEETRKALTANEKLPLNDMRSFLQETCRYLLSHLPIGNKLLRDLAAIHPSHQQANDADKCIRRIAQALPQVFDDSDIPGLIDEWKVYQLEEIPDDFAVKDDGTPHRVDHYWQKVFQMKTLSGAVKFKQIQTLIKAVLCICHGNSDVERSLSVNKRVIGTDRTLLTEESLNGLRSVKDAVASNGDRIEDMPYTRDLLTTTRNAAGQYKLRLEKKRNEEKKAKEKEEADAREREAQLKAYEDRKRKLKEDEHDLTKQYKENQAKLKAAQELFKEANSKLADALKDKDVKTKVTVAQGLLEVAQKQMSTAQAAMDSWQIRRTSVDQKRIKLINDSKSKYGN